MVRFDCTYSGLLCVCFSFASGCKGDWSRYGAVDREATDPESVLLTLSQNGEVELPLLIEKAKELSMQ